MEQRSATNADANNADGLTCSANASDVTRNVPTRVNEILKERDALHGQLAILAKELTMLLEYDPRSLEAWRLRQVVCEQTSYEDAMRWIMERKKNVR